MANQYINKVIYGGQTLIDLTSDDVAAEDVLAGKKFHLPSGEEGTGTGPNIRSDTVTAADVKSGVTFHTKDGVASTGSAPIVAATTIYPSTSDQTIASGSFLTGAQTIKGVTTAGISAANIKAGVTVKVGDSSDDDRVISVTGTFTADADALATEILNTKTAYVNGVKITGTMPNIGSQVSTITEKDQSVSIAQGYHDNGGKVSIASAEQAKIVAENIKNGVEILGVTGTYGGETQPTEELSATPYTTAKVYTPTSGYLYNKVTVAAIAYTETDNTAGGKTVTIGTVAPA